MNNFINQPNQLGMSMSSSQRNQFSYFNPSLGTGTSTNNIVWVQGIEGAKAWQLNPNSMVILLDSEAEGKMYIKVSDNIGMSSLRVFNYTEEVPVNNNNHNVTTNNDLDLSEYVKKDELNILVKELLNEQSVSTVKSAGGEPQPAADIKQPKIITVKKQ